MTGTDGRREDRPHAADTARLAIETWTSLFRAQVVLGRGFADADVWGELSPREYDVLYTLSKASEGLRITQLNEQAMLTQPGMSKLIARLEEHGLVQRRPDPDDARAQRVELTGLGREVQYAVGRRHGRQIVRAMTRALDARQLEQLRELCIALITAAETEKE